MTKTLIWIKGARDGVKWRKTVRLLGFDRMIWLSYSPAKGQYSSRRRKNVPKVFQRWATALVSTDQMTFSPSPGARTTLDNLRADHGDRITTAPVWALRAEHQIKEDYSRALKSAGITLLGFRLSWNPSSLPSLLFLSFRVRISIQYLSHNYIWKVHNLSDFIVLQLERNFASG